MALWGNVENLVIAGSPTSVTIVGTASSEFWTAEADNNDFTVVPTGTTILLDSGLEGFVVVEALLSDTLARVSKMSGVGTAVDQSYAASYTTQPISLKNDPGYAPSSADGSLGRTQRPVGLSTGDVTATRATVWEAGAGWVGVTTYMDNSVTPPALRVKKEILVAMSGINTTGTVREYPGSFE